MKNGKIIVSMTSYPKRITNVSKSIWFLLSKQTLPPDEIHIWLAEPEFPNKEKDLPEDLQTIIQHQKVKLHWLAKNTYCHKRHEIFKYTNKNDSIFLIDDDVKYNDRLIKTVMMDHEKYPNTIINYELYSLHLYNGRKILYRGHAVRPPSVNVRWCGQSMIPDNIYPKEILTNEMENIRDRICPICDESWLTPWLVYHNVPVFCEHFGWGIEINQNIKKEHGLVNITHSKEPNGYEKRDNWLYEILHTFPKLLECYKTKFGYCAL